MRLATYEHLKFELAALLRDEEPMPGHRAEHAGLLSALAQDRFNLVTVGRFNRGKSSLMNALLGTERLPMGIIPLTSVITAVQYGSAERATLYYHGTNLFMDITIAELARHVTEAGNPGNIEGIERAEIELPADLLRRGFRFIDTPGLGSSIAANSQTTQNFLPAADAFLIVTSVDAPLSEEELAVIQRAVARNARVFLALNKSDLLDPPDLATVHDHVARAIRQRFGDIVPIFPVSARLAMAANRSDNPAGEDDSGMGPLRAALVAFLTADKSRIFLANMAQRIANHLAPGRKDDAILRLHAIETKIGEIAGSVDVAINPMASMTDSVAQCAICMAVESAVFDATARMQARLGHDAAFRQTFAESGGLCPPHTWQFETIAGPLSVATGLARLVETRATQLDESVQAPTGHECFICTEATGAQAHAVARSASRINAGEPEQSLICLPHWPLLLAAVHSDRAQDARARQSAMMTRLAEDMQRFMLKRAGQQRFAITTEETSASAHAVTLLAGRPHAYPLQPALTSASCCKHDEFN